MFTGIIEATGTIRQLEQQAGGDQRIVVEAGKLEMGDVALGDSIAVNGVCLTVIEFGADWFAADVSNETLACTTLGSLQPGSPVNLEKALLPTTRLGGHLVSGHVDGVAEVTGRVPDARSVRFTIRAPAELARYIAAKGSICVEGVSLTVNAVDGRDFTLNIVPHTLAETTLDQLQAGDLVNIEVDVIARYLERLLMGDPEKSSEERKLDRTLLAEAGFIKTDIT